MPEILLSLIVILLLIAVIAMLFFRRQEISVKVENTNGARRCSLTPAGFNGGCRVARYDQQPRPKLPLDYHHGWLVEKEGPHTGRKYRTELAQHDASGLAMTIRSLLTTIRFHRRHAKIERQKRKNLCSMT
jgi:hypothetical protein